MTRFFVTVVAIVSLGFSLQARDMMIRDGSRKWRFAEVKGTSRIPLEFMRSGIDLGRLSEVSLPRYWIAEKPVTEGEFAELMGRAVRSGRNADDSVVDIEWADAEAFCRKFTQKYSSRLPDNTIASMPSMIEWAHAVRVLEGRLDLCGETGTFLFTGSLSGGFLHTLWRGMVPEEKGRTANETLASRQVVTLKRCRQPKVGLRLVLVDVSKEMQGIHPIVARGIVALQHGLNEAALFYLKLALDRGELSLDAKTHAEDALDCAQMPRNEDMEDWSGLVALSARFASAHGFETEPYASVWQMRGYREMADPACTRAYSKARIGGGWLSIRDLPREVRRDQAAETSNMVQVVVCDFTGDGRTDLVVERFGAVGAYGYWYDFYARQTNGVYVNVHSLQTVGLCVVPRKSGRGCGFIAVEKCSNPVLTASLVSFSDGKMSSVSAHDKPFCMLDAQDDRLYVASPFIGAGQGLGWSILEERGIWYRPLYWPWKPGKVFRLKGQSKEAK